MGGARQSFRPEHWASATPFAPFRGWRRSWNGQVVPGGALSRPPGRPCIYRSDQMTKMIVRLAAVGLTAAAGLAIAAGPAAAGDEYWPRGAGSRRWAMISGPRAAG